MQKLRCNPRQWKSSLQQLANFSFWLVLMPVLWFWLPCSSTAAATSTCSRWTFNYYPDGSWKVFQVYLHLMKEHGLVFGIHQAYLLEYLFCTIAVACAFDFTLQFDWVLDREEWTKSITDVNETRRLIDVIENSSSAINGSYFQFSLQDWKLKKKLTTMNKCW